MDFVTFGEFVVTLLKILTRTRKRVISRDIRPAIILANDNYHHYHYHDDDIDCNGDDGQAYLGQCLVE